MKCGQQNCNEVAAYIYTWPGKDQAVICEKHVEKLRATANALGMYLQVLPFNGLNSGVLTANEKD